MSRRVVLVRRQPGPATAVWGGLLLLPVTAARAFLRAVWWLALLIVLVPLVVLR